MFLVGKTFTIHKGLLTKRGGGVSLELRSLSSVLNHQGLRGFLTANDSANVSGTSKTCRRAQLQLANSVIGLIVTKRMYLQGLNQRLEEFPNIYKIDLSNSRIITPAIIAAHYPKLSVTRNPIFIYFFYLVLHTLTNYLKSRLSNLLFWKYAIILEDRFLLPYLS
mgnify:CR=1 FL=1